MAPSDPLTDLRVREYRAASDLGHPRLGSEHRLMALVGSESASGQALRACGLSYEAVHAAVSGLSDSYVQRGPRDAEASGKWVDPAHMRIDARAEGLAAGMGSAVVREEHQLLAML